MIFDFQCPVTTDFDKLFGIIVDCECCKPPATAETYWLNSQVTIDHSEAILSHHETTGSDPPGLHIRLVHTNKVLTLSFDGDGLLCLAFPKRGGLGSEGGLKRSL